MGKTTIEWCDFSFNPWLGCTEVGPACDHCYARAMMADRLGRVSWGAGEDRIKTSAANWAQPLRWNRAAEAGGGRPTVFCLSLGDIWDNEVDPMWRRDLFALIEKTPRLTWLLLSKRIGNAVKMCCPEAGNPCLPRNAALGATMVTQDEWDRDAPKLEEATNRLGAMFSFASVEPMLGPIDARLHMPRWVICGGESGTHARPMHPEWARSLRDQCAEARVPFFFKQWGEWAPGYCGDGPPSRTERVASFWAGSWNYGTQTPRESAEGHIDDEPDVYRLGKRGAGRLLDGIEHSGTP